MWPLEPLSVLHVSKPNDVEFTSAYYHSHSQFSQMWLMETMKVKASSRKLLLHALLVVIPINQSRNFQGYYRDSFAPNTSRLFIQHLGRGVLLQIS